MDKEMPDLLDEIIKNMENTEESLKKSLANFKAINEKSNNALMHVENQNAQILNIDKNDTVFSFNSGTYQAMANIIELFYINKVSQPYKNTSGIGNFSVLNSYCNAHQARLNTTISNFRKLKTFNEKFAEITEMVKSMQHILNNTNDDDSSAEPDEHDVNQ